MPIEQVEARDQLVNFGSSAFRQLRISPQLSSALEHLAMSLLRLAQYGSLAVETLIQAAELPVQLVGIVLLAYKLGKTRFVFSN
jgi:hypothetical protein